MNSLIIDIRENFLRAALSNDGVLEYCRTFEFSLPTSDKEDGGEQTGLYIPARDNPYLVYYDLKDSGSAQHAELKEIVKTIRSDINGSIDATHLILPPYEVTIASHKMPKLPRTDIEKLIERKIIAETKEDFPPFAIIPGEIEQKSQTWSSVYVPAAAIQGYRRMFSNCRLRLTSITTPVNAMLDAFKGVREAIFNAHAVFEIQPGFIEAYFISADGLLHFERMPYSVGGTAAAKSDDNNSKNQKYRLFKIIDTIFRINTHYQGIAPQIPIQMAWICGGGDALDEIAIALKEAMSVEVGIAPAIPTGVSDESAYVPLAGFASSLQNGTATTYATADLMRRFPLRRTSGIAIYAISTLAAVVAFLLTEKDYRALQAQVPSFKATTDKSTKTATKPIASPNVEALKRFETRQFNFYPLFRQLANDLPDGIVIESMAYHQKDDSGTTDISALAPLPTGTNDGQALSRLMAMLRNSQILKKYREPVISYVSKEKNRYMKITFSCEVKSIDSTK